ncbi:MAG: type II toxin-antitoxin system HicB family antitoxin [Synergistaceae bacterium]|jgi:predicted RNase H-like HicB family nuclease|nr:type II toxin-antitoxin system HicB family antitoxin [Synergistaceae bacterium]
MKFVYPACFYKEDNERYSVTIPDFDIATFGDNIAEAMYMASDAIAGRVHLAIKEGERIPSPRDIKDVEPDDDSGFVSMVYVDLDYSAPSRDERPIKKTLTIPSWLNQAAERQRINFSATLKEALMEKLSV